MRRPDDFFADYDDFGRFDRSMKKALAFTSGVLLFCALFWAGVIVALVWLAFRIWG